MNVMQDIQNQISYMHADVGRQAVPTQIDALAEFVPIGIERSGNGGWMAQKVIRGEDVLIASGKCLMTVQRQYLDWARQNYSLANYMYAIKRIKKQIKQKPWCVSKKDIEILGVGSAEK